MKSLRGIISDRIRSGEIPRDAVFPNKRPSTDDVPSAKAIRSARGQGLGNPARSDRSAKTRED